MFDMDKKVLTLEPSGQRVNVPKGKSFLEAIRESGSYVAADCGGKGTCGKCIVSILPTPCPTEADLEHLTEKQIQQGLRLACQHNVEQDTRVLLLSSSEAVKILTDGLVLESDFELDRERGIGVGVDIGTTTVVCYFMDLSTGSQIASSSSLNPQIAYGEDVISRITHVLREQNGIEDLRRSLWDTISKMIERCCENGDPTKETVRRIAVVANTAMHHIALGLDVEPLALAPYTPSMKHAHETQASNLGLTRIGNTSVYFAPNIAGYVGGDALGFILSQQLHKREGVTFGIDVGTNGEIIASSGGRILCCSTAAGPAFEGARIAQGMRAQEGAIEYVSIDKVDEAPGISIIGDVPPKGLCGSGILDCVAELLRIGLVDASGRLQKHKRVTELEKLGEAYVLRFPSEIGTEKHIVMTQRDIRQVQLAKAAIRTGIEVLMSEMEIGADSINAFYLAGAFGNYLRPESALRIGLLPPVKKERIIPVGNAAGEGAKLIVLSRAARSEMERIAQSAEYVELAQIPDFDDIFVRAMHLGTKLPGSHTIG
jgi:uncharacterized 2Fe-2S/4Fe-4S cluster protein (DUF4445 family)